MINHNLDSLRYHLHFFDLNGDGKDDVVFAGQSGGEPLELSIFIRTDTGYNKVFSEMQAAVKLEWQDKRLSRLYIDNWGCCDAYETRHMIYDVSYDGTGMPHFQKVQEELSIDLGPLPDTLLEKPYRFEVLNPAYNIRFEPKIDDTTFHIWDEDSLLRRPSGNMIGKLPKGATGLALAKRRDRTGRDWLFVQLDEAYMPRNPIIYREDSFPTKLLGWISGRYIRKL